jgi:hypothetical protein
MSSTNKDVWGWINPTTLIKETLGVLIASENLNTGGHGGRVKQTYNRDGVYVVVEGYIGQGMPYDKGLGSVYKIS